MRRLAFMIAALAALTGGSAQARPYLMLFADQTGFWAMDLGDIKRQGIESVEVTMIQAPLAGAPAGDKLAPLVKRRFAVDCAKTRWRLLSTTYADAKDTVLLNDPTSTDWSAFGEDRFAPVVQDAACLNRFQQQMVSRYLNLGEILANFQRAWAKPQPEPLTQKQLEDQQYQHGH